MHISAEGTSTVGREWQYLHHGSCQQLKEVCLFYMFGFLTIKTINVREFLLGPVVLTSGQVARDLFGQVKSVGII